jgi:hypothetical protein
MTIELKIRTITIEASVSHATRLKNRITSLINQKRVDQKNFDL